MFKKIFRFFVPANNMANVIGTMTKKARAISKEQATIAEVMTGIADNAKKAADEALAEKAMADAFVSNFENLMAPKAPAVEEVAE